MPNQEYSDLHRACLNGDVDAVRRLASVLDINAVASDNLHTPLMMACQLGRYEVAKALLTLGADVHIRDSEGHTALHWASLKLEQPQLVRLLLESSAEVNSQTDVGLTPLCYAAILGFSGNCEVLLAGGADPKLLCREWTAEQLARQYGHYTLADHLKEQATSGHVGNRPDNEGGQG